ncbi:MAG: cytochrome C [Alteromonadaceae bacterium]|nr:MAG: cytochrome C [Alteromonadaceae bacterium]
MSFSLLSDATPEQNAQICASCHGANGKSSIPTYPHLAGQNKLYIEAQLNAFKTGTRKSPIMSPMAASLTDDEIKSLAEYYSKI